MTEPLQIDPCPLCSLREPHMHNLGGEGLSLRREVRDLAIAYIFVHNRVSFPWLLELDRL